MTWVKRKETQKRLSRYRLRDGNTAKLKPITHQRRDLTIELSRVGRCTRPSAVVTQFAILQLDKFSTCPVFNFSTKSVVDLLRIQYTPPTRLNSTVESRRRRRCVHVLGISKRKPSASADTCFCTLPLVLCEYSKFEIIAQLFDFIRFEMKKTLFAHH